MFTAVTFLYQFVKINYTKAIPKKRIYQHRYSCKNVLNGEIALFLSVKNNLYNFDFDNTKIFDIGNNYNNRVILGMIYIKKIKIQLNSKLIITFN